MNNTEETYKKKLFKTIIMLTSIIITEIKPDNNSSEYLTDRYRVLTKSESIFNLAKKYIEVQEEIKNILK